MEALPWRLVTFDIDGTLTTVHGWRVIAEATGRLAELRESNQRFFARQSTEDEHLSELLALGEGLTVAGLEELLERTPKLTGIAEGVAGLRRRGVRSALLTHNPAYVCRWYQRRFGFDDFEGCEAPTLTGGRIPVAGRVHADKRSGLRRLLGRHRVAPVEVAHVGDGWADVPVFRWTGGGVAVNSDRPEVCAAATASLRTRSFDAVVRVLGGMVPRNPLNDVLANDEPLNT